MTESSDNDDPEGEEEEVEHHPAEDPPQLRLSRLHLPVVRWSHRLKSWPPHGLDLCRPASQSSHVEGTEGWSYPEEEILHISEDHHEQGYAEEAVDHSHHPTHCRRHAKIAVT